MTLEEKLKEYTEDPHNLALENTMRERNGVPIILCVPLDEAILICQEAINEVCKKQREICTDQLKLYVDDDRIDGLHKLILNAPSPLDEVK